MTNDKRLIWNIDEREKILHTPVFDVWQQKETHASGLSGNYVGIECPDWVVIVAVHQEKFVLVKQFRHGCEKVTLEFPAGVADKIGSIEGNAIRELEEETGFKAGKVTFLGKVSANTALFKNNIHVFLAEDLIQTGSQHLDKDEFLEYLEMPIEEVINSYGNEEFTHAYMGTALAFYFRYLISKGK